MPTLFIAGVLALTCQTAQPAAVKIPDKNLEAVLRAELRDVKGDLTEAQLAANIVDFHWARSFFRA